MCARVPPPTHERQSEVLRRQLKRVRESLDEPMPVAGLAPVMIEWHACHMPNVFGHVVDETKELIAEARTRVPYWSDGWQRIVPLQLALLVAERGYEPLREIPEKLAIGLWHHHLAVRARARSYVYWVAPFTDAEVLTVPLIRAWEAGRLCSELLYLTSLCHDGFEALWRLRELVTDSPPELDGALRDLAAGATVWNPFTGDVHELAVYMFAESIDISEHIPEWSRDGSVPEPELARLYRWMLRNDVHDLTKPASDLRALQQRHDDMTEGDQLRCPLSIDGAWYRLVRLPSERCIVEQYRDDRWSETGDVTPAAFIKKLREVKGV